MSRTKDVHAASVIAAGIQNIHTSLLYSASVSWRGGGWNIVSRSVQPQGQFRAPNTALNLHETLQMHRSGNDPYDYDRIMSVHIGEVCRPRYHRLRDDNGSRSMFLYSVVI